MAFFYCHIAKAEYCDFVEGSKKTLTIALGMITVPVDTPVGETFLTKDYMYDSLSAHQVIQCRDQEGIPDDNNFGFNLVTNMSGVSASPNVYQTNIPGVGVKVSRLAP